MRKVVRAAVLVTPLLAAITAAPVQARPVPLRCTDLAGLTIPAGAIGLPTSGGHVTAARLVAATATTGEYCLADAALGPVDPAAPAIKLRVAMPTRWNRKALMFGGGGYDGTIPDIAANVPFGPDHQPTPPSPATQDTRPHRASRRAPPSTARSAPTTKPSATSPATR